MTIIQRARLKDIKESDLMQILYWRNQDSIRKVMYNSEIISLDQHQKWFERLQESESAISKIFYFDQVPYGVLNINHIDLINNSCEWGFYIGANNAPRGIGTMLGYTSLNYIFKELKIRKLIAKVLSTNEKSLVFHQKLGFIHEGILPEHKIIEDYCMDIHLFRLLNEEWEKKYVYIYKMIEERYL
jgi:UDP-4-amino-4,6-dideoxy-N-acetyl-beta-L-altrosamine N-acetyltransferase